MKAARLEAYGGMDAVAVRRLPDPAVSEGTVLIDVHAAGINPYDVKMRSGAYKDITPLTLPVTLGNDVSGTILEVGNGVTEFNVGDRVFGWSGVMAGGTGAFAERTLARASVIARLPVTADPIMSAGLPTAGVSALQALTELIGLKSDQRILIHGGTGGIGSIAIQLAKAAGAHVATTVRTSGRAYANALRADAIVNFKRQKFDELLANYDAVLDTVGGETYARSFAVLKPGGVIVSMLEPPNEALMAQYGVRALILMTQVTTERLKRLRDHVEQGDVHLHVDRTYPLTRVRQALNALEKRRHRGKIILTMKRG